MTARARFADKTVVVTGASRGIGAEVAVAFAREGAFVCVGFRSGRDGAHATLARVREAGGEGELVEIDVRDRASVERAIAGVVSLRKRIDVLVNNAAIVADAPFAMMPPEDFTDVIATNLNGVFYCCRAVIRAMMSARSGAIVNVASVAGIHASPGQANYAASKGGVIALTRTLAAEAAGYGVRVNALVPGLVSAGMAQRLDRRVAERIAGDVPLKRFATPDEIANAVLFLASDEASYVIGHALVVDGGLTL